MNGIELKLERIWSKLPQYRVAAELGITQTELCAYENERRPLTPEMIEAIGQAIQRLRASSFEWEDSGRTKK